MGLFSKKLIAQEKIDAIAAAIKEAEKKTSGEIRVHIEAHCKKDAMQRAIEVFHQLEMQKTAQRNGVLIYVALLDKSFAIIGDEGIHQKVPSEFWESTKEAMMKYFKEEKIVEGVIEGVTLAGEKLQAFFPYHRDDKNELNDEVSFE